MEVGFARSVLLRFGAVAVLLLLASVVLLVFDPPPPRRTAARLGAFFHVNPGRRGAPPP